MLDIGKLSFNAQNTLSALEVALNYIYHSEADDDEKIINLLFVLESARAEADEVLSMLYETPIANFNIDTEAIIEENKALKSKIKEMQEDIRRLKSVKTKMSNIT